MLLTHTHTAYISSDDHKQMDIVFITSIIQIFGINIILVKLTLNISAFAFENIKLNKLYSVPFSIIKQQLKLIGVHGTLPIGTQFLALKVIRPEHASAIIEALPTGISVVVVPPRSQSIATNVVMTMEDVITTA